MADGAPSLPVNMIRADMLDIPQVPFPTGFGIRTMRGDEAALWTRIERECEGAEAIPGDLFGREFGDDLPATQERCFFITRDGGASDGDEPAVGVISAWYSRDFRGEELGRIHWLAVRPACRRKGLARAALSHAMNVLARWHARCWLATQTHRLPAIRLYLDFGFQPDLEPEGAIKAWQGVRAALDHPGLAHIA